MNYELKKRFFKEPLIVYSCPSCKHSLESDLSDAGSPDDCPICKATFVVPALEYVTHLIEEQWKAQAEKVRQQEALEQQKRQKVADKEMARAEKKRNTELAKAEREMRLFAESHQDRAQGNTDWQQLGQALGKLLMALGRMQGRTRKRPRSRGWSSRRRTRK